MASEGGGTFEMFYSPKQAQSFVDSANDAAATTPSEWYVVWVGRKIGVLSKKEMLDSVRTLSEARMRGPLDEEDAYKL